MPIRSNRLTSSGQNTKILLIFFTHHHIFGAGKEQPPEGFLLVFGFFFGWLGDFWFLLEAFFPEETPGLSLLRYFLYFFCFDRTCFLHGRWKGWAQRCFQPRPGDDAQQRVPRLVGDMGGAAGDGSPSSRVPSLGPSLWWRGNKARWK